MRRLHILRHAKSSWGDAGLDDFDRPLNRRGERAAAALGVYCRQIGLAPDHVICSPARRTQMTWAAIAPYLSSLTSLPPPRTIEQPPAAYGADARTWRALIAAVPNDTAALLIVGHNPGLEDLARSLSGGDPRLTAFPTAAFATIAFDAAGWRQAMAGTGLLEDFQVPKLLV